MGFIHLRLIDTKQNLYSYAVHVILLMKSEIVGSPSYPQSHDNLVDMRFLNCSFYCILRCFSDPSIRAKKARHLPSMWSVKGSNNKFQGRLK